MHQKSQLSIFYTSGHRLANSSYFTLNQLIIVSYRKQHIIGTPLAIVKTTGRTKPHGAKRVDGQRSLKKLFERETISATTAGTL